MYKLRDNQTIYQHFPWQLGTGFHCFQHDFSHSHCSDLKDSLKSQSDSLENDFRAKVLQLETELAKQRERCLTLIEEKEDEVKIL